jgi:hypothetical protein
MKMLIVTLTILALATPALAQQWPPAPPLNCFTFCTPQGICTTSCGR